MQNTTPTGFVYAIHAVGTTRVKIGFTTDLEKRLTMLQIGSPFPLELIFKMPGDMTAERKLHRHFQSRCVFGEWFEFTNGQIEQIKKGEILRLAPFDFKALLPNLKTGSWW